MKLKSIELNGTYKVVYFDASFVIYDEQGNAIYYENSDGHWEKSKYDEKGNEIYHENSNGFWAKWEYDKKDNRTYYENSDGYWFKTEYDEKGKQIYYENSDGEIFDERVKELTIKQIEKLLGYKIKVKGE